MGARSYKRKPTAAERERERLTKRYGRKRGHNLKHRYGLELAEFDRLVREQRGRCAICGALKGIGGLHTDHSHRSGRVRGLLCRSCNLAIGLLRDSPKRCIAAAEYLTRRRPRGRRQHDSEYPEEEHMITEQTMPQTWLRATHIRQPRKVTG